MRDKRESMSGSLPSDADLINYLIGGGIREANPAEARTLSEAPPSSPANPMPIIPPGPEASPQMTVSPQPYEARSSLAKRAAFYLVALIFYAGAMTLILDLFSKGLIVEMLIATALALLWIPLARALYRLMVGLWRTLEGVDTLSAKVIPSTRALKERLLSLPMMDKMMLIIQTILLILFGSDVFSRRSLGSLPLYLFDAIAVFLLFRLLERVSRERGQGSETGGPVNDLHGGGEETREVGT
jgi:hypothetical protein